MTFDVQPVETLMLFYVRKTSILLQYLYSVIELTRDHVMTNIGKQLLSIQYIYIYVYIYIYRQFTSRFYIKAFIAQ